MPVGSCPLTLSLLRDILSTKWSPSFVTVTVGVASYLWFIGQGMVWSMPLGSPKGTLPTLLLKSPSTGPSWEFVRGPGTVPQRMPLTLHLIQIHHGVPQLGLLAGGLYPLVRILSDMF